MTLGDVRRALEQQGVCLTPSQIDYALRANRIAEVPLDGAGNRVFAAQHIDALRRYATTPRRPGRCPRRLTLTKEC